MQNKQYYKQIKWYWNSLKQYLTYKEYRLSQRVSFKKDNESESTIYISDLTYPQ